MPRLVINLLGPITHCELNIEEFMIFTGEQASGKSTVAKCVFLFKNVRNILYTQIKKASLLGARDDSEINFSPLTQLTKEIRAVFLQVFGSTWCMDNSMYILYEYTEGVSIKISLKEDPYNPNYIWIECSDFLKGFLHELSPCYLPGKEIGPAEMERIKQKIDAFFCEEEEVVYIPAGRSMITLLSAQLNYIYSSMDDIQKRNIDYCTQNYLERILRLKSAFNQSAERMISNILHMTNKKVNKELLFEMAGLMRSILQGEYRNVDGEERLFVTENRYVKINFASSGQQESVWILNVLFYYLLNNIKTYFIIEEPESHLFPNAQKLIAEFISLARGDKNKLFITTHSPYILGTFNNLLYAHRIAEDVDEKELCEIVAKNKWLSYSGISAFFIKRGQLENCTDEEFEAIDNEVIDGASQDINKDFDRMVELKEKG